MKYLFLAVVLLVAVAAQERRYPIFPRSCDERKAHFNAVAKDSFSTAAYTGTWFELGRYQQRDEAEADCMSSQYTWGFITRTMRIERAGKDFVNDAIFERSATALLAFPDESPLRGMMNVTYYQDREATGVNYYIIATDYFQYAVGWACEDLAENESREFAWLLSRTPQLPENSTYQARIDTLVDLHFDSELIRRTEQSEAYCLDRVLPGQH